ncbi:MAG: hypothetical protein ACRDTU_08965 [Micromonosporaceae bacterium]
MPRVNVYLPDDLYAVVKEQNLPVSELLQDAISLKLAHDERLAALNDLIRRDAEEFGEPTPEEMAEAEESARRILAGGRSAKRQAC